HNTFHNTSKKKKKDKPTSLFTDRRKENAILSKINANSDTFFTVGHSDGTLLIYSLGNSHPIELLGKDGQKSSILNAQRENRHFYQDNTITQQSDIYFNQNISLQNIIKKERDFYALSKITDDSLNDSLTAPHNQTIWDISYHPMGHLMASGSMDMSVKVWGWE
ncbi:hypothetical protein M153_30433000504, partial [Pseudoloma neurophilia]